ncbi:MAG: hypothetical protein Harvfovirus62_10 [Harvfovirus sp.]|uniref:Uncharacterized protein n=1 Tax=Harvfovirus sp. TaxID=2487768 RepID=A0A3G5A3L2_9VIRU|nr:MAG: hypothetical protein Harvfovirus62_10 [Harvfovirus sp.]
MCDIVSEQMDSKLIWSLPNMNSRIGLDCLMKFDVVYFERYSGHVGLSSKNVGSKLRIKVKFAVRISIEINILRLFFSV